MSPHLEQLPEEIVSLMRSVGSDLSSLEVKSARAEFPKDALKTISSFSNTSGGTLIFGISEDDDFAPVPGFDPKRIADGLAHACREKMTPPVTPTIEYGSYRGSVVLVAHIREMRPTEKPCYITASNMYDGSYVRVGDGDCKLSAYEIDRLREERTQPKHDIELVEDATLDDLSKGLLDALLARERSINPLIFGTLDDVAALTQLHVIGLDAHGEVRPTLAGLMTLGTYPQSFFPSLGVTFVAFPGTRHEPFSSNQRYLDSRDIGGPIPIMVAEVISAIQRNTRTGAVVDGAFRREVPEYPIGALREAIANALMHRDYSPDGRGGQVQVNLYRDCLEITNPGGLFGGVTVDTIGTPGVSSTRNQWLSRLLASSPYPSEIEGARYVVENKGTGFVEIRRTLAEALMREPLLFDSPSRFTLVFERRRLSASESGGIVASELNGALLQLIDEQGTISAREAQEASGLSRATVLNHINQLIGKGIIEPTEPAGSKRRRYRRA